MVTTQDQQTNAVNKKSSFGFIPFVRRLDFFGKTIAMNYKGSSTYQTTMGAFCTVIMVLFVVIYSSLKFLEFLNYDQPDFIVNTVLKDMHQDYPEPFVASDNRFEFAVAFLSVLPYRFKAHDPRIGQMNMRMVEMETKNEAITFTKHPFPSAPCNADKNFLHDDT